MMLICYEYILLSKGGLPISQARTLLKQGDRYVLQYG